MARGPWKVSIWDGGILICRWNLCGKSFDHPESLFDHLCDTHISRRRTDDLQQTCQWDNCDMTPVENKMVQHVLTHVPWRPFKCEFCGRASKRLQHHQLHIKHCHPHEYARLEAAKALPQPDITRNQPSAQQQPAKTEAKTQTKHWKNRMDKKTLAYVRDSLVMFQRKMREPDCNLTDRQGAKIVSKALKGSGLKGARTFRRYLKRRTKDEGFTWKSLMEEFD